MLAYKHKHQRTGALSPCPELWIALKEGHGLVEILREFYRHVYNDPRLNSFFDGITIERAIEKQFSFLRSIFTGEKCYFGDHPKKAHNWMVISNELFDYREQLMEDCLRKYGLSEDLIQKWRSVEEVFRAAIVKDKPLDVKNDGTLRPADGYTYDTLDIDTICDDCETEIPAHQEIITHIRTGKVYCGNCRVTKNIKIFASCDDKDYQAVTIK